MLAFGLEMLAFGLEKVGVKKFNCNVISIVYFFQVFACIFFPFLIPFLIVFADQIENEVSVSFLNFYF